MSQSALYHLFRFYGYHHLRSQMKGGSFYFYIVRAKKRCYSCRSYKVVQRGYCWRRLQTIPAGPTPVFVVIKMRRFYCESCHKTRFENLMIADRRKHYTHALEKYVMSLCSMATIKDVASHLGLHWTTVKAIDRKRLRRNLPREKDFRGVNYLGIDEVSVRKGHRYLTTVVDLESGRVLYVAQGRRRASLEPFIKRLKRAGIRPKAIALDMWKPYAKAIRLHYRGLPLVYDVFHIIADYSRILNEIRVEEYERLEGQEQGRFIKGSRYLLLKGQEKLSLPAQQKLQQLLAINRPISIAYVLKEDLRQLWSLPSRYQAEKYLSDWIDKALSSKIIQLARFARKLRRHSEGILNYFNFRISTAKVEGINNRIKVIKRMAYGFRDLDYFMLKIYNLHNQKYALTR
jgi:transposase